MSGTASPVDSGGSGDSAEASVTAAFWSSWPVLRNRPHEPALVFLCSRGRTWTEVADELAGAGRIRFEERHAGDTPTESAASVLAASPDHFLLIAEAQDGDVVEAITAQTGSRSVGQILVDASTAPAEVAELVRARVSGLDP